MKQNKKRLLYFHHGGTKAGAARSLSFLLDKLDLNLYEACVVYVVDSENEKLFGEKGVDTLFAPDIRPFHGSTVAKVSFLSFFKQSIKLPITIYRAKKIIEEYKPDLVHINSTCLWPVARASKAYSKKLPVVCHIREPLLDNWLGNILSNQSNSYVDAFISIDKYDASTVDTSNRRLDIIYNFVDFNHYNPNIKSNNLRKQLKIKKDDIVYLYLARITPANGAKEMLITLEEWLKNNINCHLLIIGDDENNNEKYANDVRALSKKHANVHLLGFRKDVAQVISECDIMVCPFKQPHFARSIIEAAAMSKPSIATNIGGPQELIINNETGLLFNQDFSDIENAFELLKHDSNLRLKLGKSAYKYAHENFNADYNAKKVFDIYDSLINTSEEDNGKK